MASPVPPPPGSATNTDSPPSAPASVAPSAAAPGERPDDVLTITHATTGNSTTMTRREWQASPASDPRSGWTVVNAQANPQNPAAVAAAAAAPASTAAPAPASAPPAPPPAGLTAGFGPAYMQAIKQYQAGLGRPMTLNDFYALADPTNNLGLGAVKEVRVPTADELAVFGGSKPQAIVEYANGLKLGINATTDALGDGGAGVTADQITGFSFNPPTTKSSAQTQADIAQATAQARLANASAAKQEALNNGGIGLKEAEANIAQSRAAVEQASATSERIRAELAAGKPEAEVAQILGSTAAATSQANSAAQNAATNQGRLVLDATLGEIDRRYKEGLIDNETRRILSSHAYNRWQADNANTQTVVAAAGKGLEADLTERNQNIALDNTRVNAANTGFSDDMRTTQTAAQYLDPARAEELIYGGLFGLQGLRKSTIQDWGGLQTYAPARRPGVLEQLGYNTPITLRSLESVDDIEQQKNDIRAGRTAAGIMTEPVKVPAVVPTRVPTVVVPTPTRSAPAPVPTRTTPPPPVTPSQATDFVNRGINPATGEPIITVPVPEQPVSQSNVQSGALLASSLQPVRFAQGGTPIAVKDLFGRTRPTIDRYPWLR